jgi:hypothetical protein
MMKRLPPTLLAIALAAATATGCGGGSSGAHALPEAALVEDASPATLSGQAPHYLPGESMSWRISLRGIAGAEAVLMVGHPGLIDERPAVVIRSRVESTGVARSFKKVRDDVITWVDLETGVPLRHEADLLFGDRRTRVETSFRAGGYHLVAQRPNGNKVSRRQVLPPGEVAHDGHSIMGVLRAWQPAPGTRATFFTVGGQRLWRSTVQAGGVETVSTALGPVPALRIDGVAERLTGGLQRDKSRSPRTYSIWISTDERRLPVQVRAHTELGDVIVELVDYDRPVVAVSHR